MKILIALWQKTKFMLEKVFFCPAIHLWAMYNRFHMSSEYKVYESISIEKLPLTDISSKLQLLRSGPEGNNLWAVCCSPKYVQYNVDLKSQMSAAEEVFKIADEHFDCKELAFWASNTVDKNLYPTVLLFRWADKDGNLDGHAMCVCRQKDGRIFRIDNFGVSATYSDIREICDEIGKIESIREAIGWALIDKNMKILKCGKEHPSGSVY